MEEIKIVMPDGIFLQCYLKNNDADHWMIITHGVSEYHQRHLYLKDLFGEKLNYFFYDLRGHGDSSGQKQYIDHFSQYAEDLKEIITYLKECMGAENYLLFAHSLGGLITSDFMKNYVDKAHYPRLVYLSSPPVNASGILGLLAKKAPMPLYSVLVNMPLSFRLKVLAQNNLSHDPKVHEIADADPYCGNGMHTKLSFEAMKKAREVFSTPLNLNCPGFVSIGTGDKIVSPYSLIKYFSTVEKNFKLKVIKDGYHELHHETDDYREPYIQFLEQSVHSVL